MENQRPPFKAPALLSVAGAKNGVYYYHTLLNENSKRKEPSKYPADHTGIIVETQEAERKKISEELHDNVCQTLGAIKLFIDQMLETNKLKRRTIRKCSVYLHEVINELRHIAHNMGMVWLQEHSFCTALQKFVAMMQEIRRISIRLNMEQFDDSGLDSRTQLIIFRIIQEQVHNVLKHARASEINITLMKTGQFGYLRIADNGIGADITGPAMKEGAGLKNIRHRVEIISGVMEITTSPGKGFILEVQFPVMHAVNQVSA